MAIKNKKNSKSHPQKPVALYELAVKQLTQRKAIKYLDTHLGSAEFNNCLVKKLGFAYMGFELDPDYFKSASERIAKFDSQENLFDILNEQKQETEQENLFKEDVVYPKKWRSKVWKYL